MAHVKRSFTGKQNGKQSGYFKAAHCASSFLHVFVPLEKAISSCSCPWFSFTLTVNAGGAAKHYLRRAGCAEPRTLGPGWHHMGAVCPCTASPFSPHPAGGYPSQAVSNPSSLPLLSGLNTASVLLICCIPVCCSSLNTSSAPHIKPSPAIVLSKSSPSRRRVRLPSYSPPSTPSSRGTQRACCRFRRKGKSLKRCSQMESNTDTAPSHFCSCCSGPLRGAGATCLFHRIWESGSDSSRNISVLQKHVRAAGMP